MDTIIQEFLQSHRISVLGVLQEDNVIHSAALHFAHSKDPFYFYFITDRNSRKCASLLSGQRQNASLVIGFDEAEFATFQAEGSVQILADEKDLDVGWKTYGEKFPDRSGGRVDEDIALLRFVPTWWRYTDMKTKPATVIASTTT